MNTYVTSWLWEADLVELPESERNRIARLFTEGISTSAPSVGFPSDVNITVGDRNGPFVEIRSDDGSHRFAFELNHARVSHRYMPPRTNKLTDPVGSHIRKIAGPLLQRLAKDNEIVGRFTTTGIVYELTSFLEPGAVTNKQQVIERLVSGLGSRPWEGPPGSTWKTLQRIDLRWATVIDVQAGDATEQASLWFKVECPANDKHSRVNTTCVLKSEAKTMPSEAWAGATQDLHQVTWQIAVNFVTWLLTTPR